MTLTTEPETASIAGVCVEVGVGRSGRRDRLAAEALEHPGETLRVERLLELREEPRRALGHDRVDRAEDARLGHGARDRRRGGRPERAGDEPDEDRRRGEDRGHAADGVEPADGAPWPARPEPAADGDGERLAESRAEEDREHDDDGAQAVAVLERRPEVDDPRHREHRQGAAAEEAREREDRDDEALPVAGPRVGQEDDDEEDVEQRAAHRRHPIRRARTAVIDGRMSRGIGRRTRSSHGRVRPASSKVSWSSIAVKPQM